MAYRLASGEPVRDGLRRIAREQIDRTLRDIDDLAGEPKLAVHRFRRRSKKIRALLRLFRGELEKDGTFRRENRALRDLSRTLSDVRDADVMIDTFDGLSGNENAADIQSRFPSIRQALVEERLDLDARLGNSLPALIADAVSGLRETRARIETWHVENEGFAAIGPGLLKTCGRAYLRYHDAMADPTPERLHEWRKRTKYHRNHLRLITGLWPEVLSVRAREVEVLAEMLGDDHDLALLGRKLNEAPDRFGGNAVVAEFSALIDEHRSRMFSGIALRGARLFAEPPEQFVGTIASLWTIWERSMPPQHQVAAI